MKYCWRQPWRTWPLRNFVTLVTRRIIPCIWSSRNGIALFSYVTCQRAWRPIICRRRWITCTVTRSCMLMTSRRITRIVPPWWLTWPRCSLRTWKIWVFLRMPWWGEWWKSLLLLKKRRLTWMRSRLSMITWVWRLWCLTGCHWTWWVWWNWWMIILLRPRWPVRFCFCRKIRWFPESRIPAWGFSTVRKPVFLSRRRMKLGVIPWLIAGDWNRKTWRLTSGVNWWSPWNRSCSTWMTLSRNCGKNRFVRRWLPGMPLLRKSVLKTWWLPRISRRMIPILTRITWNIPVFVTWPIPLLMRWDRLGQTRRRVRLLTHPCWFTVTSSSWSTTGVSCRPHNLILPWEVRNYRMTWWKRLWFTWWRTKWDIVWDSCTTWPLRQPFRLIRCVLYRLLKNTGRHLVLWTTLVSIMWRNLGMRAWNWRPRIWVFMTNFWLNGIISLFPERETSGKNNLSWNNGSTNMREIQFIAMGANRYRVVMTRVLLRKIWGMIRWKPASMAWRIWSIFFPTCKDGSMMIRIILIVKRCMDRLWRNITVICGTWCITSVESIWQK